MSTELDPWGNVVESSHGSYIQGAPDAEYCAMNPFGCDPKACELAEMQFYRDAQLPDEPDGGVAGKPVTSITINTDVNPPFAGEPKSKLPSSASGTGWSASISWTGGSDPLVKGETVSATFAITTTGKNYFELEEKADPEDPDVYKPVTVTVKGVAQTVTPTDGKTLPPVGPISFGPFTAVSYELTVSTNNGGTVNVVTGEAHTQTGNTYKIEGGDNVTVTAVPASSKSPFLNWAGVVSGTANPETFTMPNAKSTLTANFETPPPAPEGYKGSILNSTGGVEQLQGVEVESDDPRFAVLNPLASQKKGDTRWVTTEDGPLDTPLRLFWLSRTGTQFKIWNDASGSKGTTDMSSSFTVVNCKIDGVAYMGLIYTVNGLELSGQENFWFEQVN